MNWWKRYWRHTAAVLSVGFFLFAQTNAAYSVGRVFGVSLPWKHERRSRRMPCFNQLRNVSIAILNYASLHDDRLPSAYAQPHGVDVSWRVTVLPLFDQAALFEKYDQTARWFEPPNHTLATQSVHGYRCPDAPEDHGQFVTTTYVVPTGPGTPMDGQAANIDAIAAADGLASTVLISERHHDRPVWSEPRDASLPGSLPPALNRGTPPRLPTLGSVDDASPTTVFSTSHGSVNAIFLDGHGAAFSPNIDPSVLNALLTYNGCEETPGNF